jgi:hypothetical protein
MSGVFLLLLLLLLLLLRVAVPEWDPLYTTSKAGRHPDRLI